MLVTDFGLAVCVGSTQEDCVFPWRITPPETYVTSQLTTQERNSALQSDVFTLGFLIYHLWTGRVLAFVVLFVFSFCIVLFEYSFLASVCPTDLAYSLVFC